MTQTALEQLCNETGLKIPRLLQARTVTTKRLARRAELLTAVGLPSNAAMVFVGSWGRHETSSGSDNDFYVLFEKDIEELDDAVLQASQKALLTEEREFSASSNEFRGPGREGTFGGPVSLKHLLGRIGRNHDSNDNFTHRMLLVLESVAVHNPDLHRRARNAIIENYLEPPIKPLQPPRLFLNDVVRYWRTMCVDFVGKMRERRGQGWGLRNAKLRTTRKMLFTSGLLPVLRCQDLDQHAIPEFLMSQFELRPMDRVASAFLALDQADAGAEVFDSYERFFQRLDSDGIRNSLDDISSRAEANESEIFQSVARIGDDFERSLLNLLFGPALRKTTQRFGIF